MYRMTDEEFEGIVSDALDSIPDHLFEALENVIVTVADEPDDDQLAAMDSDGAEVCDDELLGLYDGLPLTERGAYYGEGDLPDVITIFKGPHERCFAEEGEDVLLDEIRRTVIHEVGHFFGNDEETLAAMGY